MLKPLINGTPGTVKIVSGSSVSIVFGSKVDLEQLPLKTIMIDWGDNSPPLIDPWDANSKDVENPHVYTYHYTNDSVDDVVTYTPRIMLIDNWGWCSGENGSDFRAVDANGGINLQKCDSWTDVDNSVDVYKEYVDIP